uniref:Solute carrier family 26 member 6-like n=1 Tax=Diabrotica virgifera virgifera TaxID=50390 RepID=A0A6P7GST4_DIAVI
MIQQAVGGVTQLVSVVSASILLVIVLWIGPFFETLPKCVLASIIVVALKGMLLQCTLLPRYWRLSRWDAIVWIVTFSVTCFVQISYGLAAGVGVSLLSIFVQGYKPYTCLLGIVPNTDLYLDIKRYKGTTSPVFEVMHKCDEVEKKEKKFLIFPTVHDAVLYTQVNVLSKDK